ncbi:MAG: hypothetical protein IPG81_13800 [Sandaracinaceae bacterium]|nr:hypothetical protein [Sandaracinaceae bacterium]
MVDTRPGFLLVGHGAFPISDGVVQPPREAPQGTRLVDAVRVEGGETLVTALNRNDVHVDWPGAQGEGCTRVPRPIPGAIAVVGGSPATGSGWWS